MMNDKEQNIFFNIEETEIFNNDQGVFSDATSK